MMDGWEGGREGNLCRHCRKAYNFTPSKKWFIFEDIHTFQQKCLLCLPYVYVYFILLSRYNIIFNPTDKKLFEAETASLLTR